MLIEQNVCPRIMLVDDDDATIEVYKEYLELEGMKLVASATNGFDAVTLYKTQRPDLIFVDVMMPDHDGFVALREIRRLDPSIPIIMVTADLSSNTEKKLSLLGATKIIYKPFEIKQLTDCIDKYLK